MGITGGIDTEERSRFTATTLKKESPSSHSYSMKTAIVLASVALLAAISNHGCESAPANQEPKINRVQKGKDRELSLDWEARESAHELDAWIEETHTLEERVKYLENWASNIGWKINSLDEAEVNLGNMVMTVSDDLADFEYENSWDAIRSKINDGIHVEDQCENEWYQDSYGDWQRGEESDCELIISVEDYY